MLKEALLVTLLGALVAAQDENYGWALEYSILFYKAQRSGWLPADNGIDWRGNSATGDGNDVGHDLTGGWYDAGDHVKFGFPMAASTTLLAWGLLEFKQGYINAGHHASGLDSIRWPLDYFIKCHVSTNNFFGQLGDGHTDHAVWGRPEDMTMYRPAWKITDNAPGSELAGETAAAMAAGSLVFRDVGDVGYADTLLDHARRLYDFAYNHRGTYVDSITNARDFYNSWNGYNDELCWGALWLYKATGEQHYLDKAFEFWQESVGFLFSWDDKGAGTAILMYELTNGATGLKAINEFRSMWRDGYGGVKITPGGFRWSNEWGSLRYCANSVFIHLLAAQKGIDYAGNREFAFSQIDYMLGKNPRGSSYVIGYGNNFPRRPHHRAASCPRAPAWCDWSDYNTWDWNDHDLNGALVGGPNEWDEYYDDRTNFQTNEVATDYNAAFQGCVAGLSM